MKNMKKKNRQKGFTLIELLAVLIILSIIMGIAIPNVISTLDRSKKDTYISDAKKFLTLAKTKLATDITKPYGKEAVKITLSCVDNQDLTKDPEGNNYDEDNSFVIVTKTETGELTYHVNLVAIDSEGKPTRGIRLKKKSELDGDNRLQYVEKNITIPSDDEIMKVIGANSIVSCKP
ncbi:MAG: type II secretion system protein [bacterium]|nr:type II secretion system protein [bacterium]